jgi:hypothetical protein
VNTLREGTVTIEQFEQHIRNLDQTEILSGAISSLNKLLVDKKIVQESELQDYFLEWMRHREKGTQKRAKTRRSHKQREQ